MKIIANQSILHNNVTNCTFIASELDEEVQTGTRENDGHIEWMGNLNLPYTLKSRIAELEAENATLREALEGIKLYASHDDNDQYGIYEEKAEQALKGKEVKGE